MFQKLGTHTPHMVLYPMKVHQDANTEGHCLFCMSFFRMSNPVVCGNTRITHSERARAKKVGESKEQKWSANQQIEALRRVDLRRL